jgi:hypothetical protein
MNIMLGNLSVEEIEQRIGINFPEDIKKYMEENRQENASRIAKGKWHCFDIPFAIVCGDMNIAKKIYNSVSSRSSEIKEPLQFSIQQ